MKTSVDEITHDGRTLDYATGVGDLGVIITANAEGVTLSLPPGPLWPTIAGAFFLLLILFISAFGLFWSWESLELVTSLLWLIACAACAAGIWRAAAHIVARCRRFIPGATFYLTADPTATRLRDPDWILVRSVRVHDFPKSALRIGDVYGNNLDLLTNRPIEMLEPLAARLRRELQVPDFP